MSGKREKKRSYVRNSLGHLSRSQPLQNLPKTIKDDEELREAGSTIKRIVILAPHLKESSQHDFTSKVLFPTLPTAAKYRTEQHRQ